MVGIWLVVGGTAQCAESKALETPKDDSSCCQTVGNFDGSADGLVTMGDLTRMIDCLFIFTSWNCCACDAECNLDMSPDCLVGLGDLTVIIDHLYITLTPLPSCDAMPCGHQATPW